MRIETITRNLRHEFSNEEKLRLADSLTSAVMLLKETREAKSDSDREFKEQIEQHLSNIQQFSSLYRDGFKEQETICKVLWNRPNVGEKTIVRLDTGEEAAVELMTDEEKQEEMQFGVEENRQVKQMLEEIPPLDWKIKPPEDTEGPPMESA